MEFNTTSTSVSRGRLWAGRAMSGLASLFLLADGVAKLFKPAPVLEGTLQLGYAENVIIPLGIVLTVCTILYVVPRTSLLGALLLTGYLGGAVATHVRVGAPWFPVLFPVMMGTLVWGGLWMRDQRVRELLPLIGGLRQPGTSVEITASHLPQLGQ
ncbi:DoxX family protein [uncultured Paludibaculum sp.]|uniref:DoxX family protein n=1 Tax=uncultured Paludibaculum sp. TaxID=1765020 RepID=UPI002AAB0CE7|nr:DoxX family protein [uncultured Paludibaculum sp.]